MWAALGRGENGFWVSVFTGGVAEVHLERRSRLPGYCIVVWRHGHVAEPGDLDPLQAGRYRAEVLAYRLSMKAGNPLSEHKLAQMFGRTSRRWARVRIAEARQSP